MHIWAKPIQQQLINHAKGGGKESRAEDIRKIMSILTWVAGNTDARDAYGIGCKHIVDFWRAHIHLLDKTRYEYWRAACILWRCLGRPDKPPKPFKRLTADDSESLSCGGKNFIASAGLAVLAARASKRVSIETLAVAASVDPKKIANLESGRGNRITLGEYDRIFSALGTELILTANSSGKDAGASKPISDNGDGNAHN